MFQSTRRRLAIWYTAVTAMLLLLFASGVYFYVRSTLIERIDDTLNHVVEVVERSLVIESDYPNPSQLHINVEATFRDNADTVEDDHIDLEWFSPTGELLWSTLSEPLNIPINSNRTGETVQVVRHEGQGEDTAVRGFPPSLQVSVDKGNSKSPLGIRGRRGQGNKGTFERSSLLLRQVTQRVQIGGQVIGYLRVSHPWFEVTKPIQQLLVDLSLGTGLMVFSVAASGWFLSGKAMEPVRESYQRLKQFTADASHELRNPIALIQTNVQVALTDPEPELQSHRQQLKVVERLTKRLGRLVDDLLFLARQDSGIVPPQFSACPLDALLMEVVEEQQLIAAEKSITLALKLVDPPNETTPELVDNWFTLSGDWNQLARLFTNLLGNAVHYTPNGGKVSVQLQRTVVAKEFSLSPLPTHLQVKIGDTGIGIPESALPHLFDRFYRVDPARTHTATTPNIDKSTGSGLGLAIAAAIVENHQGQIQVASTMHQGTTFTVTLPLLAEY